VTTTATASTVRTSTDARAAAQGSLALTALQTLGRLLAVGFVLVATRHLAPSVFGRYSTASAFVVIGGILADFGTTMVIVRRVSRDPTSSDALLTGTLPACFGLGVASMLGVALFAVAAGYPSATRTDVLIASLALPASACVTSVLGAVDGHGLIARRALLTFLQMAVLAGGGVVGILTVGVRGAVVAIPAAPLVALVAGAVVARRARVWSLRVRWDRPASIALLRDAVPFGVLGAIAGLQLRFDVVLLSVVGTAAETARYDLAVRALEALAYVGTVVATPALFILSRRLGHGDGPGAQRALDKAARFLALLGVPVSALLVGLHGPLTVAAFGPRYAGAAVPLAIAGGSLWLAFLAALQTAAILAGDRVWRAVPVAAGAMVVMVGLDVALVPRFGAVGAAAATVAGTVVMVTAFGRFLRRTSGLRTACPSLRVLGAGVVTAAVAARLAPTGLVAAGAAASIVFAGLVLVTGAVRRADVDRLRALAGGRGAAR
jgi:O-antigen/teichoic acid export membrane protein